MTSATNSTKPIEIALAKAARYYLYGRHHVSKSTFDDEAFREILTGYFDAGGGEGRIKFLTRRGLIYYIHGEFELFKLYLRHVIAQVKESAQGNQFSQGLHIGETLSDKKKRIAGGVQFIDRDWDMNHVICICMTVISSGAANPTAKLLRRVSKECMGADFDTVIASMTQDLAATAVARAMEQSSDDCDMHQISKISSFSIGDLVSKEGRGCCESLSRGSSGHGKKP